MTSSNSRPPLTTVLLRLYFPTVQDFRTYLTEILEPQDVGGDTGKRHLFFPDDSDSVSYRDLINNSVVASRRTGEEMRQKGRLRVFPAMSDMREIIDKAQERLFNSKAPQNVVTAGYRLAYKDGDRGKKGMSRVGITNWFVNTIITALQAPEWDTLLERVGVDAMLHLLTETWVFVSLPNGCLCQMTGEPIIHMTPRSREITGPQPSEASVGSPRSGKRSFPYPPDEHEPPAKRLKLSSSTNSGTISHKPATVKPIEHSPADIALVRARLFYARPGLAAHTNHIIVGLPSKHILNRIHPSFERRPKPEVFVDPDPKTQAEYARHVAKYVFPRQYALSSPFKSFSTKRGAFVFPNYLDRELEIRGSCKTPRRLKGILPLIDKMIWMHGKCGYRALRDIACPSKLHSSGDKEQDITMILEMLSEAPFRSQYSLGAGDISVNTTRRSDVSFEAEKFPKNKPRFVEFSCSYVEVYRYAVLITNAVIPRAFWGSKSNFKLILRYVKNFISFRRYETLSLHNVLQGFSTSQCGWLMPTGPGAHKQTRVSVSDSLKRRELLEEFLFWYFDSFLLQLLKTTFYITESSAFKNQVLYFRQDDWQTLCAPLVERLTATTFERMSESEAGEVLRQRRLGFSFVRLLPKDTGVRPIVNLRRRKGQKGTFGAELSINQILQAAFHILTYEKKNQPSLLGVSVFGTDEVYAKLKSFKSRLPLDANGNLPKLYFVKVDVQACFDTIEQTKLLEILRELITEDVYMIQRYGEVAMSSGRAKRTYAKKAVPEDEHPHFLKYAAQLASALRNTIFVDQVTYQYSRKQEILQLLEEHITENIVKIGSDYYRQKVGIPQGSVLSSLLCAFFYGDMEKRFKRFTQDLESLLLRLIDDYLFITTSLSKAKGFLDQMSAGHPEYGCFISKEKTKTNFDYDAQILNVTEPLQKRFLWCGYAIDMEDLSVCGDYSRYHETNLAASLTVGRGRRPGAAFVHKMLQLAKTKCHIIYSDLGLNTERVVHLNIYQNFLLVAMKMHAYLQAWKLESRKNATFIHHTVRKVIDYSYAALRNKAMGKLSKSHAGHSNVEKVVVTWLGTHAFHTILSRKPQHHASLLRSLAFELSRPRYRRYGIRFRGLIREGLEGLAEISF